MNEHSVFEGSWLELREPLDHRSRSRELLPPLRAWWTNRVHGAERIVDLASGSGSNLRYLAPRLPAAQRWILVDQDPELLGRVEVPEVAGGVLEVIEMCRDLRDDPKGLVRDADLVTGSAFLDLVSREWLEDLVEGCRGSEAGACFAMTYDGDFRWYADESRRTPMAPPADAPVRDAVNRHQRREKGFGPALGPRAAPEAARLFEDVGYRTWIRPSPWVLGPDEEGVVLRLLEGWEGAAVEEAPESAAAVRAWAEKRRAAVRRGSFGLTVGHLDLLALPDSEREPKGGRRRRPGDPDPDPGAEAPEART